MAKKAAKKDKETKKELEAKKDKETKKELEAEKDEAKSRDAEKLELLAEDGTLALVFCDDGDMIVTTNPGRYITDQIGDVTPDALEEELGDFKVAVLVQSGEFTQVDGEELEWEDASALFAAEAVGWRLILK